MVTKKRGVRCNAVIFDVTNKSDMLPVKSKDSVSSMFSRLKMFRMDNPASKVSDL